MSIIFTSELIVPLNNFVEILINQVEISSGVSLTVSKYSSDNVLIGEIIPDISYIENDTVDKTRIRVFLKEYDLTASDQIKIELNSINV